MGLSHWSPVCPGGVWPRGQEMSCGKWGSLQERVGCPSGVVSKRGDQRQELNSEQWHFEVKRGVLGSDLVPGPAYKVGDLGQVHEHSPHL